MIALFFQAATDGSGGVTIPLPWLLASLATATGAIFGAIKVLLSRIERQYLTQIADIKETHKTTIADLKEAQARELLTCTKRLERLEAGEDERLVLFQQAVEAAARQADVSEAMYGQLKAAAVTPRRTRAGSGSD